MSYFVAAGGTAIIFGTMAQMVTLKSVMSKEAGWRVEGTITVIRDSKHAYRGASKQQLKRMTEYALICHRLGTSFVLE